MPSGADSARLMPNCLTPSTTSKEESAGQAAGGTTTGIAKVAVMFDYWNAHKGAKQAIRCWEADGWRAVCPRDGHFNPVLLAQRIVARSPGQRLARVGIYRGIPDQRRDPAGHAQAMRQFQRWLATAQRMGTKCVPGVQQLGYHQNGQPYEKGIDARAAAEVVLARAEHGLDVVVLFSGDSDLLPALAGAYRLGAVCETAAWSRGDRRLGPKSFISQRHMLGPHDYEHACRSEQSG